MVCFSAEGRNIFICLEEPYGGRDWKDEYKANRLTTQEVYLRVFLQWMVAYCLTAQSQFHRWSLCLWATCFCVLNHVFINLWGHMCYFLASEYSAHQWISIGWHKNSWFWPFKNNEGQWRAPGNYGDSWICGWVFYGFLLEIGITFIKEFTCGLLHKAFAILKFYHWRL